MDKYEILETIRDKMENIEGGAFAFLDWLQDFVDEQLDD